MCETACVLCEVCDVCEVCENQIAHLHRTACVAVQVTRDSHQHPPSDRSHSRLPTPLGYNTQAVKHKEK